MENQNKNYVSSDSDQDTVSSQVSISASSGQNAPSEVDGGESFKSFLWEAVKLVIICLIIIVPVRQFLIQPFYVKGASMEPNFHDHEYLIIDEISYRFNEPERGEIVVFRHPPGENNFYIKRIIGLPLEKVVIKNNKVMIYNIDQPEGFVLDESSYLPADTKFYDEVDVALGENQFFVMGDNRISSLDSRKFGPVVYEDIIGKTWLRGWPVNKFTVFETPQYN